MLYMGKDTIVVPKIWGANGRDAMPKQTASAPEKKTDGIPFCHSQNEACQNTAMGSKDTETLKLRS